MLQIASANNIDLSGYGFGVVPTPEPIVGISLYGSDGTTTRRDLAEILYYTLANEEPPGSLSDAMNAFGLTDITEVYDMLGIESNEWASLKDIYGIPDMVDVPNTFTAQDVADAMNSEMGRIFYSS